MIIKTMPDGRQVRMHVKSDYLKPAPEPRHYFSWLPWRRKRQKACTHPRHRKFGRCPTCGLRSDWQIF